MGITFENLFKFIHDVSINSMIFPQLYINHHQFITTILYDILFVAWIVYRILKGD